MVGGWFIDYLRDRADGVAVGGYLACLFLLNYFLLSWKAGRRILFIYRWRGKICFWLLGGFRRCFCCMVLRHDCFYFLETYYIMSGA